jgi:hypothetical protein
MQLDLIQLGCTFTPEKYPDQNTAYEAFRFVLETLKLTKIRFPIRWNQVATNTEKIDLDYYLPFFEIATEFDELDMCLNLGPIKTTDWPEIHVPKNILDSLEKIPTWPQELQKGHELNIKGKKYLDSLCRQLKQDLSPKILGSIKIIQLNNEGYNPFGEQRVVTSTDAEVEFCKIALKHFPNAKILFNSAGKLQVRKILKTIQRLSHPSILGIDYYYHTPTNDYPLIIDINQLELPLPWIPSFQKVNQVLQSQDSTLEFTEVQMEKWGHVEYPGYSKEALEKTILKLSKYRPPWQKDVLLRLWGVELLAHIFITHQQTQEHEELVEFIRGFNS